MTCNIIGQGNSTPTDQQAGVAFAKLVGMVDTCNADPLRELTAARSIFQLQPGKQSYTIGQDSSLDIIEPRPSRILRAHGVYASALPNPQPYSIPVLNWSEYERMGNQGTPVDMPTGLFYDRNCAPIPAPNDPAPDFGVVPGFGTIWFVGVPIQANFVEFWTARPLTQASTHFDDLVFPTGYYEFLLYGLCARLYPAFGREPDATVLALYKDSQRIVESANATPAPVMRLDSGLPGGAPGYWDGRSNQWVNR